jgi:nitrite reductase/ring-hydroxylating ferredoxin subunit
MKTWYKVSKKAELGVGKCLAVTVNDHQIALANVDGEIFAVDDTCTHAEASLCDGCFDGEELECPLHFAKFNVKTGKALCALATKDLNIYNVRVVEDDIEVEM